MYRERQIGLWLGVILWALPTRAQEPSTSPVIHITYKKALALARKQAPALTISHARIQEATQQIDKVSLWRFNPQLSGAVGPRFGAEEITVDGSIFARQWVELGGQRSHRINAAQAGVTAENARYEDTERHVLREVSFAFVETLYWKHRIELAKDNASLLERTVTTANQRFELGDGDGVEPPLATLALIRAQTDVDRVEAFFVQAQNRLKKWLGIQVKTEVLCRDSLAQFLRLHANIDHVSNIDAENRADVQALNAEILRTDAEVEAGRAKRIPNIALGAGYVREESSNIVQGTFAIDLPLFDYGQGAALTAEARKNRLQTEVGKKKITIPIEIHTAKTVSHKLDEAVRRFENEGLEALVQSENRVMQGYKAGAVELGERLAIQRELMKAKVDYAELLYQAARAHVELFASTGTFP